MTKPTQKETSAPIVTKGSLFKTTADIAKAIVAANTKGNALQVDYHKIACSIIVHLATNKDIRVARSMLDTMPESLRKDSMSKFLDLYAPVSFDEEGQVHYDADKPAKLGEALAAPWWKAKLPTVYKPFDFEAEVQRLLERAEQRLTKGVSTEKGDKLSAANVAALRSLIKHPTKPVAVDEVKAETVKVKAEVKTVKPAKVKKAA